MVMLMPSHFVGCKSSPVLSSSEYEDLSGVNCSLTLPSTVVPPHVMALGFSELSIFSTGLGRFRFDGGLGGDSEEEAMVNGRENAAKLEAKPELARRTVRGFSGDVDKLCECWSSLSKLVRFDLSGGVSPQEYEAEAGSLLQGPFEPKDPYRPEGVCANFGVDTTEFIGVLEYMLH
jgi:hypothetical protein